MRGIVLVAAFLLSFVAQAEAQSCRNYSQSTRQAIGSQVQSLYEIETLVLHRMMGGHYPAFYELARRASTIADAIYTDAGALAESRTRRCRNYVPPIRRTCRDAAERLVDVVDESALRSLSDTTRLDYVRLITRCEMWLALPRRSSLLRIP